jgi:signal transduction histidine kinase
MDKVLLLEIEADDYVVKPREELKRQERIATIGRLSTWIVHHLRNPLAAIYGGAEMLIDGNLSPQQVEGTVKGPDDKPLAVRRRQDRPRSRQRQL